jgi:hypothetical protein
MQWNKIIDSPGPDTPYTNPYSDSLISPRWVGGIFVSQIPSVSDRSHTKIGSTTTAAEKANTGSDWFTEVVEHAATKNQKINIENDTCQPIITVIYHIDNC